MELILKYWLKIINNGTDNANTFSENWRIKLLNFLLLGGINCYLLLTILFYFLKFENICLLSFIAFIIELLSFSLLSKKNYKLSAIIMTLENLIIFNILGFQYTSTDIFSFLILLLIITVFIVFDKFIVYFSFFILGVINIFALKIYKVGSFYSLEFNFELAIEIVATIYLFIAFEISKRSNRTYQKELSEQNSLLSKYFSVIENSKASIIITDTNGNIEYSNPQYEIMTGHSFSEIQGKNPRILQAGKTEDIVYKDLWDTITNGKVWNGSFINIKKNKEEYTERAFIYPVLDDNKNITSYIAILEDVTELAKYEKTIEDQNTFYQILINNIPVSIYFKNEDLKYKIVNYEYAKSYNLEKEDIIGKTDIEIFDRELAVFNETIDRQVMITQKPIIEEEIYYNFTDMKVWVLTSRVPAYNSESKCIGLIVVSQDITYRKAHETEKIKFYKELVESNEIIESNLKQKDELLNDLSKYQEELEETIASKDKLFSIISHDLRGPFTGLMNLTDLISKNTISLSFNQVKEMAESLNKASTYTLKLIENLFTWARIQTNSIEFNLSDISLTEKIENIIKTLNIQASQKHISVLANLEDNYFVRGDKNMLNTIIRNLINNALKFTPQGGVIKIGVNPHYAEDEIMVYVKDNGIGMEEAVLRKLFKNNQKVTIPGTDNEPGTGLGLLLCSEFVEKHGGKIWAESEFGEGSTFYFTIKKNLQ
jgi:PAS domain S-box-containing protein